ncbi:hypothetical protein RUND412_011231 [Rhizina undulata]
MPKAKKTQAPLLQRSRGSSTHYQTFPTTPPRSRGAPPHDATSLSRSASNDSPSSRTSRCRHRDGNGSSDDDEEECHHTPMPKRQLLILAIISLAEQTALNSILPYLPDMVSRFANADTDKVGVLVGVIASSFAAAQFATNFYWGRLSDSIGRKPVVLLSTLLTTVCFVAFGFCRTLWQVVAVQALMGAINGNAGIVSTILGEITDKSNQSESFAYLPMIYGIGGITGPLIGGLLSNTVVTASNPFFGIVNKYPYLFPNAVCATLLIVDLVLSIFLLDESLQAAKDLPPFSQRLRSLFSWLWQFTASSRPSYLRGHHHHNNNIPAESDSEPDAEIESPPLTLFPVLSKPVSYRSILNPQICIILATYGIFSLSNVSYNSLYPIFMSSPPPIGRGVSPKEIGLSLGYTGAITVTFQAVLFGPLERRLGICRAYRLSLVGLTIAFLTIPFVGYYNPSKPDSKLWLWTEVGSILLIKTLATVVGLTCAMLLITNSSPEPSTLGTLNGLAQTLSAGGRAVGPFLSGGLFTLATRIGRKGGFLAWGVFGGISAVGAGLSWWLKKREEVGKDSEEENGRGREIYDS